MTTWRAPTLTRRGITCITGRKRRGFPARYELAGNVRLTASNKPVGVIMPRGGLRCTGSALGPPPAGPSVALITARNYRMSEEPR